MARIHRAARPSRLTAADRARQRAAVARHDRRLASERRRERIARLLVVSFWVIVAVAFFYGISN